MLSRLVLQRVSTLLNRALSDSTRARALCAQLEGRRLCVVVTGSPWTGEVLARATQLELRLMPAAEPCAADAVIHGSAVALLGATGDAQRTLLHSGALRIEGDAEIAQRFAELLRQLRPDVEHELARLFGPMPAHLLWRGARSAWQRGRALLRDQSRNAADWLAHERRTLVPLAEAEHRYREIETARERLDRVEARLRQLETPP